jgi:hypothetical protein
VPRNARIRLEIHKFRHLILATHQEDQKKCAFLNACDSIWKIIDIRNTLFLWQFDRIGNLNLQQMISFMIDLFSDIEQVVPNQ